MQDGKTYTFHIAAYSPDTIPMAVLAEYMAEFAALLGSEHSVHFVSVEPGSTNIVSRAEREDAPKVDQRLISVRDGTATQDLLKAFHALDTKLANDNATGRILAEDDDGTVEIIIFPGCSRPKPRTFGPMNQEGTLDGVVTSVVGADDTISVQLQNGDMKYTHLVATLDVGRELAKNFRQPVRLIGQGRWLREADGSWSLMRFKIKDFYVLRDETLLQAVESLRNVAGSGWKNFDDPIGELENIRGDSKEIH